ncbi:hypothetical protein GGI25_003603 [Coemansia spiralis]|uniref:Peptidase S1 domain-containing protein n=2 Tax=Coemansia TaxID=4863 RepID=A0A9W8G8B8_9FUNG|nr:hypothetical protein BX070DRAFT_253434 [Coemansia spiralis]KAJ1991158.1 hypothetical protein EDC05_003636 [Coemansia umbellata]KAJ2621264.1 hypothetical protein GGI26_004238 [Coemansia sp. RSA 1358]KAJ2676453.1 hypothetical protein GGI25_003603 [Coemansia spiralis]
MKLFGSTAISLAILGQALALPSNFITKRDVSASQLISDFRSAQLLISSTQTSCEMAVVSNNAAFVAASCLKFYSSGQPNNSIDFRIAVNDPISGTSKVYSVTSIDVHSKYDPNTYANNIALLMFDGSPNWSQYIAYEPSAWNNLFYTSRTLSSISKATWNTPNVIETNGAGPTDTSGCLAASNLYKSNQDWMLCLTTSATSIANSKCNTPYGAAWAVFQPSDLAVAALYSHSVVYSGDSLCGSSGNQFHYYTLLQPYSAWGAKMIGKSISTFTTDSSYSYSASSGFSMSNSDAAGVSGTTIVSGDQYPVQKAYTGSSSASNTNSQSSSSSNNSGGSSNNSSGGSSNNNNSGGSSNNSGGSSNNSGGSGSNNSGNSNSNNSSGSSSSSSSSNGSNSNNNSSNSNSSSSGTSSSSASSNNSNDGDNSSMDDPSDSMGAVETQSGGDGFSVISLGGQGTFDFGNNNDSEPSSAGKTGDSEESSSEQQKSYSGLGRTATIIIATVVPIGTIAILVGLFFLYKWFRRYRNSYSWDPKSEAANIDRIRIIDEIAITEHSDVRQSTPPSYDDHLFEAAPYNNNPAGKS